MDIIEAASTKWNFNKCTRGVEGDKGIGVNHYNLIHKVII